MGIRSAVVVVVIVFSFNARPARKKRCPIQFRLVAFINITDTHILNPLVNENYMIKLATENKVDLAIIERHNPSIRDRARIELAIVRTILQSLNMKGYTFISDNGEEQCNGGDYDEHIETLFACDEARIITKNSGGKQSQIYLVLGNDGWDVIADYGVSLEDVMAPIFLEIQKAQDLYNDPQSEIKTALANLLERYVSLVNCGDCGNWNPEEEPVVIEARRLLVNENV